MNILELYFGHIIRTTVQHQFEEYKMELDYQIKNLTDYINYLTYKKAQLNKLIDSLMLSLENKYIDVAEAYQLHCASEINHRDIEKIKHQLDQIEAYYARIESDIHIQSLEKSTVENEYYLVHYMNSVA